MGCQTADLTWEHMADRDKVTELGRLLGKVATEHHEATGGASTGWAGWYASRLQGEIDSYVGFEPSVADLTEWLRSADETYRESEPGIPWPYFYAELILDTMPRDS